MSKVSPHLTKGQFLLPILTCVESYATVGEIAGELRREFGEYRAKA